MPSYEYGHGTTRRTRLCSDVQHAAELRRLNDGWIRTREAGTRRWFAVSADDPILRSWWRRLVRWFGQR